MAKYSHPVKHTVSVEHPKDRYKNQIVLSGANESLSIPKGIFWLYYLELASGDTVDILDGDGNTIITDTAGFSLAYAPLRCDHGISFSGDDVIAAIGFTMPGCLPE